MYCALKLPLIFSAALAVGIAQQPTSDSMAIDPENKPAPGVSLQTPDPLLAEARSLVRLGTLGRAEEITRQYLTRHSNSADGHYLLGYILFRQAKAKESLAEYTTGAKYRTPSAYDLEVVASDYVVLKDYMDADKWFTKAVEWNPRDALGWYYLGRTKYNENRFEEAVRAFEECLKLEPRNVKAEDNLGLAYAGLARNEEAKAAYLNAIAWQKEAAVKNAGPFINLGSLLLDENRVQEAIPYLSQACEISPQDVQAHRELGKAYLHLNQLQKAEDELQKAIQLAPKDAALHYILAQVYRKEGWNEKAKLELDRYAAMTGTHSSPETPEP